MRSEREKYLTNTVKGVRIYLNGNELIIKMG